MDQLFSESDQISKKWFIGNYFRHFDTAIDRNVITKMATYEHDSTFGFDIPHQRYRKKVIAERLNKLCQENCAELVDVKRQHDPQMGEHLIATLSNNTVFKSYDAFNDIDKDVYWHQEEVVLTKACR